MCNTLRDKLYWTHIGADVKCIVSERQSCAKNTSIYSHKRKLQLFPVAEALDIVAIVFFGANLKKSIVTEALYISSLRNTIQSQNALFLLLNQLQRIQQASPFTIASYYTEGSLTSYRRRRTIHTQILFHNVHLTRYEPSYDNGLPQENEKPSREIPQDHPYIPSALCRGTLKDLA